MAFRSLQWRLRPLATVFGFLLIFMALSVASCGNGNNDEVSEVEELTTTSTIPSGFERVDEFTGMADFESELLPIKEQQALVTWVVTGTVQEFGLSVDGSAPGKVDTVSGQRFYKVGSFGRLRVSFLGAGSWRVTVYRQGPAPTAVGSTTSGQGRAQTTTTEPPIRLRTGSGRVVEVSRVQAQEIEQARAACRQQEGKVWLPDVDTPQGICTAPDALGSAERDRAVKP